MIKNILYLIIEALMFICIIGWVKSCDDEKLAIATQNLIAAQDTIEVLQTKNGELVYEKALYILSESELRNQLNISKSELKDLKKTIGNLSALVKTNTVVKIDTIYSTKDSIIYINDTTQHYFRYNDEWLSLEGLSTEYDGLGKTILYNINVPTPITVGLTDEYKVFIKSPNPYLSITEIEGAILDKSKFSPKESHWSHGIQFGIGVQYGLFNKDLDIGPQIGYSLQYNF